MHVRKALRNSYDRIIFYPSKRTPFWIFAGFVATFAISRLIVFLSPGLHLSVSGTHVHHLTYGIITLAASGFVALAAPDVPRRAVGALYGIGLAMTFDEFGMWLHLTTNYYMDISLYVMFGILFVLLFVVYGASTIQKILHNFNS